IDDEARARLHTVASGFLDRVLHNRTERGSFHTRIEEVALQAGIGRRLLQTCRVDASGLRAQANVVRTEQPLRIPALGRHRGGGGSCSSVAPRAISPRL